MVKRKDGGVVLTVVVLVRFVEGTVDGAGFGVAVQPTKDGAVCAAEGKDDLVSGGGTEVVGGDCGEFSET